MNKKEMFYFNNSTRSVQFFRSFRPSSTPSNSFVSPGLSNTNIYSLYVKSHFNTPPLVYQKETKEEVGKTEFVQEGKGLDNDKRLKLPILVERTLLDADHQVGDGDVEAVEEKPEENKPVENKTVENKTVENKTVENKTVEIKQNKATDKRKKEVKKVNTKKAKLSFKIVD